MTRRPRAPRSTPDCPTRCGGHVSTPSILKTAPHPNAAQVLADFMITEDGQEALARKSAVGAAEHHRRGDHRRQGPAVQDLRRPDARRSSPTTRRSGTLCSSSQRTRLSDRCDRKDRGEQVSHVSIHGLTKHFDGKPPTTRDRRPRPRDRAGRVPRPPRSERLRQDDDAALPRRARDAERGSDRRSATATVFDAARRVNLSPEQAQHRHGLPVVRAVAAHDRAQEHRLPAPGPAHSSEGQQERVGRGDRRARRLRRRSSTATPRSSAAASSSASRSPAASSPAPSSCCSTSR